MEQKVSPKSTDSSLLFSNSFDIECVENKVPTGKSQSNVSMLPLGEPHGKKAKLTRLLHHKESS